MLNPERDHVPRPQGAGKPQQSIGAMAFARIVAAEYQELVSGYRNGLYDFFGRAMVSYLRFLQDPEGDPELRGQDNISGLHEKPLSGARRYWFCIISPAPAITLSGIPPAGMLQSLTTCAGKALAPTLPPITCGVRAARSQS